MSASQIQCNEAKVFIQVYREAIETIEKIAKRQKMKTSYEKFVDNVVDWQNGKLQMNDSLFRNIRIFQFSQYFFMKNMQNLTKANNFETLLGSLGGVKAEMIQK